jgi:hypothetical protein
MSRSCCNYWYGTKGHGLQQYQPARSIYLLFITPFLSPSRLQILQIIAIHHHCNYTPCFLTNLEYKIVLHFFTCMYFFNYVQNESWAFGFFYFAVSLLSVVIATRLPVRFPVGVRDFALLLEVYTGSGAHPLSSKMGLGRIMKLATHLHVVPRPRMVELCIHSRLLSRHCAYLYNWVQGQIHVYCKHVGF